MKHTAKILITMMMMSSFSAIAFASSECAGLSTDGTVVRVSVTTKGAMAAATEGEVSFEAGGNTYGYKFAKETISQFFEDDDASTSTAVVGLKAYAEKEFPLSIKYVGDNFVDMDLKDVLKTGQADGKTGNYLRVWKGPGHAATDQIQLTSPACSVWTDL